MIFPPPALGTVRGCAVTGSLRMCWAFVQSVRSGGGEAFYLLPVWDSGTGKMTTDWAAYAGWREE